MANAVWTAFSFSRLLNHMDNTAPPLSILEVVFEFLGQGLTILYTAGTWKLNCIKTIPIFRTSASVVPQGIQADSVRCLYLQYASESSGCLQTPGALCFLNKAEFELAPKDFLECWILAGAKEVPFEIGAAAHPTFKALQYG